MDPSKEGFVGALPKGDTLLAVCDPVYFTNYAIPFINSALFHQNKVHIHIIGYDITLDSGRQMMTTRPNLSLSWSNPDLPKEKELRRVAYSTYRFYIADYFLQFPFEESPLRLMVLDVDSIIRDKIPFPNCAVGLFFREPFGSNEWELKGTRVAAGITMFDDTSRPFTKMVCDNIEHHPKRWFIDQVSLAEAADHFKWAMNIYDFSTDPRYLDWEFRPDSYIWTGKGDRKFNNSTYVSEVCKYAS